MEQWRKISLIGIILGNGALLVDYFAISIPYIIMIPLLVISVILIFAGLFMRKKQKKTKQIFIGVYTKKSIDNTPKNRKCGV